MSEKLNQLESDLRHAVAGRRFHDVQRLVRELSQESARQWKQLPPGSPGAYEIFERLTHMLDWTHIMLCTARAGIAADLRRAASLKQYMRASSAGVQFEI